MSDFKEICYYISEKCDGREQNTEQNKCKTIKIYRFVTGGGLSHDDPAKCQTLECNFRDVTGIASEKICQISHSEISFWCNVDFNHDQAQGIGGMDVNPLGVM